MAKKADISAEVRELAERIAADLFKSGGCSGEIADRLVLTSKDGRDLGGWCQKALADRVEGHIEQHRKSVK